MNIIDETADLILSVTCDSPEDRAVGPRSLESALHRNRMHINLDDASLRAFLVAIFSTIHQAGTADRYQIGNLYISNNPRQIELGVVFHPAYMDPALRMIVIQPYMGIKGVPIG